MHLGQQVYVWLKCAEMCVCVYVIYLPKHRLLRIEHLKSFTSTFVSVVALRVDLHEMCATTRYTHGQRNTTYVQHPQVEVLHTVLVCVCVCLCLKRLTIALSLSMQYVKLQLLYLCESIRKITSQRKQNSEEASARRSTSC